MSRLARIGPWWIGCVLLWWGGRLGALLARRAFETAGVLPAEFAWGLAQDALLVSTCFAGARALSGLRGRWWAGATRAVPPALLSASALVRVVDGLHCHLGLAHVTVGFWWHAAWEAWPVLVESGAPVALGLAAGLAWFSWRAVGVDARRFRREQGREGGLEGALGVAPGRGGAPTPAARGATAAAGSGAALPEARPGTPGSPRRPGPPGVRRAALALAALLALDGAASLLCPPHPHHQGLLPEANLLSSWLAFHGVRVPPSARPPDEDTWRRWQAAGWVPEGARRGAPFALWRPPPAGEVPPAGGAAPSSRPPNVLIVFLESFNRALTSLAQPAPPWAGPGLPAAALTPNLARLATRMTDVRGYHTQARPTHYGLLTSLCGLLPGTWPLDVDMRGRSLPRLSCLPAWLRARGRDTVFVQGASLAYTGLDRTLAALGFDTMYGREELSPLYPDAPRNAWGMHDRQTLACAIGQLDALRAARAPFMLAVVTVDSHYPGAAHPDCHPRPAIAREPVLRAVHCADAELAALARALDRLDLWRDTIVIITADHAMQDLPEVRRLVGRDAAGPFAELPLLIHDPRGRLPRRARVTCGQTDLAPNVAALAGLRPGTAAQGRDIFGPRPDTLVLLGLMGRRAVGVRRGARHGTFTPAELARRCAEGRPLLDPSPPAPFPSACDVTRHLHWLDGLWFEDRIVPPPARLPARPRR